jgi:AcrR family transcriptional regulator
MPIEVRRQQALDAALRLIVARGYHGVTMEAIAREANLAKPVIYNAYPGLGRLLAALLEREQARGLQALADAMPPHPVDTDPTALLLGWLERLARTIAASPDPWRLMLTPPEGTPEVVRDRVQAGRALAVAQVRTVLAPFLDSSPSPDGELAAELLVAAAEHAAKLMIRYPDRYSPQRLVSFARVALETVGLR